jgi:hypothetical protein
MLLQYSPNGHRTLYEVLHCHVLVKKTDAFDRET